MPSIKCIGQFTLDDIVLPDGTVHMQTMGGNALYSAAGANLWSQKGAVGAVARIGRDYPECFIDALKKSGFNTAFLTRTTHEHLRAWLLYESNHERRSLCRNTEVLSYPPTSLASFGLYLDAYRKLHLENSPLLTDISKNLRYADAYHLAPQTFERHKENLKAIKSINPQAIVSLDPSPFYMYKGNHQEFSEILGMVDVFMPSKEELFGYFGEISPEAAAMALAKLGPNVVVIKLGRAGSYVYSKILQKGRYLPVCPVQAVDCTGAGDSFCGGFLAGFLNTRDVFYASCCGAVSASYGISDFGPSALLHANTVDAKNKLEQLLSQLAILI